MTSIEATLYGGPAGGNVVTLTDPGTHDFWLHHVDVVSGGVRRRVLYEQNGGAGSSTFSLLADVPRSDIGLFDTPIAAADLEDATPELAVGWVRQFAKGASGINANLDAFVDISVDPIVFRLTGTAVPGTPGDTVFHFAGIQRRTPVNPPADALYLVPLKTSVTGAVSGPKAERFHPKVPGYLISQWMVPGASPMWSNPVEVTLF